MRNAAASRPRPRAEAGSVARALARARARLEQAGCESPSLDAELLLAEALGVGREQLFRDPARALSAAETDRFAELLQRRARREPVAYILGRRAFRHIELAVDPRALIPRPETELLVEVALELPPRTRVLEVGTGSGAIALAIADERPDLVVTATDVSDGALALARANARRLGLSVAFARADLLLGVEGAFDALIANLPYVSEHDWPTLAPEITAHEPAEALLGGDEGLDLIERLVEQAAAIPFLALEVGDGQAPAVRALLLAAGFEAVETRRDLAGVERVVLGRR